MSFIWVFLTIIAVSSQANICRVCIDNPIVISEHETFAPLVKAVIAQNVEILNCTSTMTTISVICEGACVSIDFYSDNDTDLYIGSLRYCDLGVDYKVGEDAHHLVCSDDNCDAAVPIDKLVYSGQVLLVITLPILCCLVLLVLCLIFWKALCRRRPKKTADIFDAPRMFPEIPVQIMLDRLVSDYQDYEDNESDSMHNESVMI